MRRLAVVALIGAIAFAQMGFEQLTSRASGSAAPRHLVTTVDRARTSMPLPRTVAVAPVDEAHVRTARAAQAAADSRATRTPKASRSRASAGDVWSALAACESGGNAGARSAAGRYFGAFQFSLATWQSLGYGGNPADHAYATQLEAAQRLQARSGWGQWPRCSRRLGLR